MTDQQHPITPPPELKRQWLTNDHFPMVTGTYDLLSITRDRLNSVIDQAVQWGADQELEACLEHLFRRGFSDADILCLRAARRPKPPSLKKQALVALRDSPVDPVDETLQLSADAELIIRQALEALPND